jgi:hypothetical protein
MGGGTGGGELGDCEGALVGGTVCGGGKLMFGGNGIVSG